MNFIKENIFRRAGVDCDCEITYLKSDCMTLSFDGKHATIGYATKAQAARALFLLADALKNGKTQIDLSQKPAFDMCGAMIKASAVSPSVEGTKDYITALASMGMNMLMLYTEDLFVMEKYPYFGYLNAAYTVEELKELDEFASKMGVEMIPCIQTLAHLEKYFWAEASAFKQTAFTLMVDEPETYQFIEEQIKIMRKAFKSPRIHIGMDEAYDLGFGKYYKKHGDSNHFELFNRHLARVKDICTKYDFHPMIWSDMYFSMQGGQRYDYDENTIVPPEVIAKMPDVDMVFWDYYHDYKSFYDINIKKHQGFGKKTIFAGAVWDWDGYAPNFSYTLKTMRPALEACLENGVKEVFSTMWGGEHTMYFETLQMLPVFSEMCYLGKECTNEDIFKMRQMLTGVSCELSDALSDLYMGYDGWTAATTRFFYNDALYDLISYNFDYDKTCEIYQKSEAAIAKIKAEKSFDEAEIDFYWHIAKICLEKVKLINTLQKAYRAGDKETLKFISDKTYPLLIKLYTEFKLLLEKRWAKHMRIHGLDTAVFEISGVIGRTDFAKRKLDSYLAGEINKIEELEFDIIHDDSINTLFKAPAFYTRTRIR